MRLVGGAAGAGAQGLADANGCLKDLGMRRHQRGRGTEYPDLPRADRADHISWAVTVKAFQHHLNIRTADNDSAPPGLALHQAQLLTHAS